MRNLIILLSFVFLLLPAFASAELYFNQEYRFSLDAPQGWSIKKSSQPNTIVKFVLRDSNARIAVLSIAAYDESTLSKLVPLTADSVFETFKKEYSDFDFRRIAAGKRKIRSMNAVWNLIEITNPPQARLIGKHYHFRRNGKLWRISAMTDSGKEFFDKVLPIMEKSIATIAFGT